METGMETLTGELTKSILRHHLAFTPQFISSVGKGSRSTIISLFDISLTIIIAN